ncbi:MAG: helix-turn-helix transcriptional regulator [Rhizobium rhizophilum]|uniref:helix-turn-helix transcriptional regulator n=1 Tax=Rhizobium rhizophilum TaxID=1850373 RepID=UPI00391BAE45
MMAPPNILRAARELLGLKQTAVAEAAGLSRRTVQRLELGEFERTATSIVLQEWYETQGILFVRPAHGRGWGVFDNSQTAHSDRAPSQS